MKRTNFQRLIALVLVFTFLLSCTVISASAADAVSDDSASTTDKTLAELKAELNAIKYEEYQQKDAYLNASIPTDAIQIIGTEYYADGTTAEVSIEEYDGISALQTPGTGTVSWKVNIPKAARYNIVIRYYPIEGKSAAIERVLKINDEIPFSEARYISMQKAWSCAFTAKYQITAQDDLAAMLKEASEAGIEARSETETKKDSKGNEYKVTYMVVDYPSVVTNKTNEFINKYSLRFFTIDIDDNEIRSSLEQSPEWRVYECSDVDGFYSEPFSFVFKEGENIITLEAKNEPVAIQSITLIPETEYVSYADYIAQYKDAPKGSTPLKLEAEYFTGSSSQTIYPLEDRTDAANSPSSTKKTVLNTIGGEKWQVAGQTLRYTFSVDSDGLYSIAARFKQNVLEGMSVSRTIYLYSDLSLSEGDKGYYNGIPFAEATKATFEYDTSWQSKYIGSHDQETDTKTVFEFYFKKGVTYTIEFKVNLGEMGDVIRRVQKCLDSINADYLNIIKLTGTNPDQYRDYGFFRVMPDTIQDLYARSKELYAIAEEIEQIIGEKSSSVATLEQVAWLCNRMVDEDEVAKNLSQLKSYIGTLGTWITDAKSQPLQLDYLIIQSSDEVLPKATAGFFKSLIHEVSAFIQSFFRNYDRMGSVEESYSEDDQVQVWLASGRDQSQIIRNLVNNDFTPQYGHSVSIKLVTASTLLPSVLADMGPDVYIGLGEDNVINYAIRGALKNIENMEGFKEMAMYYEVDESFNKIYDANGDPIRNMSAQFNEAAMLVLGIADAQNKMHYYGLPETQNFPMMFIRTDVLADLNVEIPKTWDDILAIVPLLQANNMEIGLSNDYKIFLYQMGGELFADNGMRINLDSNVALESFEMMCNMFTMYSFPYKYDFENRFRTGEMPIGIASYNSTYNKLTVFATEIKGLWTMVPLPGIEDENGNINNVSVSTISAIVMLSGCKNEEGAWDFMRWHSGTDCQVKYSNEMIATIGPSAKHATANIDALSSLDWTTEEYTNIKLQFNNLASIPNYPGSYIISRYTKFAFLAALNDNKNPVDELQSYINTINKEITRKREEFELETLEIGETLASKRLKQCTLALESDIEKMGASQEQAAENLIKNTIRRAIKSQDSLALRNAAEAAKAYNAELFAETITALNNAADVLSAN